jgi:hypothetical protein
MVEWAFQNVALIRTSKISKPNKIVSAQLSAAEFLTQDVGFFSS